MKILYQYKRKKGENNMKLVTLLILILSFTGQAMEDTRDKTQIERQLYQAGFKMDDFYQLAYHSNESITNIVKLSAFRLRRKGHDETAGMIEAIWRHYDGRIIDLALGNRDIGWFEPISDAIALIYELTEQKLGFDVCHSLRIDDLKTINYALRVAFRPCFYGYDEYFKHMVKDTKYRGLIPVLSYWSIIIGCSYATYGIGYPFICAPSAYIIEKVVENKIAPKAVDALYNLACN